MFDLRIDGLQQMERDLAAIDERIRRKVNRNAAAAGIRVLAAAAKGNVPKATGATAKALGNVIRQYRRGATFLGIFGVRQGQARAVLRSFSKRGKQRVRLTRDRAAAAAATGGRAEIRDPFRTVYPLVGGRRGLAGRPKPLRLPGGQVIFRRVVRPAFANDFITRTADQALPAAVAASLQALRAGTAAALKGA